MAGPMQFFFAADYIPTRYADVYIDDDEPFTMFPNQKDFSFRFGLNFLFGRNGYVDRPFFSL